MFVKTIKIKKKKKKLRVLLFSYSGNLLKRIKTLSHCVSLSFKTIVFVFQNTFGAFKLKESYHKSYCV